MKYLHFVFQAMADFGNAVPVGLLVAMLAVCSGIANMTGKFGLVALLVFVIEGIALAGFISEPR